MLSQLRGLPAQALKADDPKNQDDVRVFLQRRLSEPGLRTKVEAYGKTLEEVATRPRPMGAGPVSGSEDCTLRRKLQKKGTKSAKRLMRRRRRKERRFATDVNHQISKEIVGAAQRTESGIAMEDLKGIRGRVRAKKKQRRSLHSSGRLANCRSLSCTRPSVPVSRSSSLTQGTLRAPVASADVSTSETEKAKRICLRGLRTHG